MLLYSNIIKEDNEDLRKKSELVNLPLSKEDEETLLAMNEYLANGYDEDFVKHNDIRPGVGLAAPQIDVLKQMFVIMAYDEKDEFYNFGVINPKIISNSIELTYLKGGEGCLSVARETTGLVHRFKRITVEAYIYDFDSKTVEKVRLRLKNYIAVVFQHEYDHLSGTLFVDRIDPINPFFIPDNSTPIEFTTENEDEKK